MYHVAPDHPLRSHVPDPHHPVMADLWAELPGAHAPHTAGRQLAPLPTQTPDAVAPATPRNDGYRESIAWSCVKHVMQLAFVGSVLLLVLSGDEAPVLALGYAATGLLLMTAMAITDRQMFLDAAGPSFEILQVVAPGVAEAASNAPAAPPFASSWAGGAQFDPAGGLSPLVAQMHVAMPERVDVT